MWPYLVALLSLLKDKSVCERMWVTLVSICLMQVLTQQSKCKHTELHGSLNFPSLYCTAVQSVSTVFLFPFCPTLTLPTQPASDKHFTYRVRQPFLVISFRLLNTIISSTTHTHTESMLPTHGLIAQKQQRSKRQWGQVRNPITVRPIGHTESSCCSELNTVDSHPLSLL